MKKTVKSIAVPLMFLDEQVVARSSIYLYLVRNSYPVCRSAEYSPRRCHKNSTHIWDAVGSNFKHKRSMHSALHHLVSAGQIIRHGGDYIIPTVREGVQAVAQMYSLQVPTPEQIQEHDRILASVLRDSGSKDEVVQDDSDLDVETLVEDALTHDTPEPVEELTEDSGGVSEPPKDASGKYTAPFTAEMIEPWPNSRLQRFERSDFSSILTWAQSCVKMEELRIERGLDEPKAKKGAA